MAAFRQAKPFIDEFLERGQPVETIFAHLSTHFRTKKTTQYR
jgi:hypothetical protein